MPRPRTTLPQLAGDLFLTDGGIETTLIFLEGFELPHFAAFHLHRTPEGTAALRKYFRTYADLARRLGVGIILETATWRANPNWGRTLGYSADALADANRQSVRLLEEIRAEYDGPGTPVVISGCIGPRGDGYVPDSAMSAAEAESYHHWQAAVLAEAGAHLITALTMNYVEEAIGVAGAARRAGLPAVIAFTVETDGRLPTGQPLRDAIAQVDASTGSYPAYYMINCAHPSHFQSIVRGGEEWTSRIRGLRANASRLSHAELNEATKLDAGDPASLGRDYAALRATALRHLNVMGGCCGTDERHVAAIAAACLPSFRGSGG